MRLGFHTSDPRWGRGSETYGEDPKLTSEMVVAFLHGLQGTSATTRSNKNGTDDSNTAAAGTPTTYTKVASVLKHFVAYSCVTFGRIHSSRSVR